LEVRKEPGDRRDQQHVVRVLRRLRASFPHFHPDVHLARLRVPADDVDLGDDDLLRAQEGLELLLQVVLIVGSPAFLPLLAGHSVGYFQGVAQLP